MRGGALASRASVVSPTDSFIQRFSALSEATPQRGRDVVLRALDITLSAFFLLVTLPLTVPIALLLLMTGGPPLFYCGERVGRGGGRLPPRQTRPPPPR